MNANHIIAEYVDRVGLPAENSDALSRCIEEEVVLLPAFPMPSTDLTYVRITGPSSTSRSSGQTVKVANVFFSLKTFASVILDTASGVLSIFSTPHLFWLHGLRLAATLKKDFTLELSEGEATIVLALFSTYGFDRFVAEDSLFSSVEEFLSSRNLHLIQESDFIRANTHLQRLGVIEIDEGRVKLLERVRVV